MRSIFIIIFFGITFQANAQFQLFNAVDEYEFVVGATSVTFAGRDWDTNKFKIGYSAGVGATWGLSDKGSITTKILAERKGIKFSSKTLYFDEAMQQQEGESTSNTNLDYLTIPLAFQYKFNQLGKNNIILMESGIYFSYLYKAQAISDFSWMSTLKYNRIDDFNKFDFGFNILLGYRLSLGNKTALKFWGNTTYGFIKAGRESGATGFLNVKNQSFGVGVSLIKVR